MAPKRVHLLLFLLLRLGQYQQSSTISVCKAFVSSNTARRRKSCLKALGDREAEIRRKIIKLKKEGKLKKKIEDPLLAELDGDDDDDDYQTEKTSPRAMDEKYSSKIRKKLGTKSKLLGFVDNDSDEEEDQEASLSTPRRQAQIGALPELTSGEEGGFSNTAPSPSTSKPLIDPSLFEDDEEEDVDSMSEEDLVDLVAARLAQKKAVQKKEGEASQKKGAQASLEEKKQQLKEMKQETTGVGGSFAGQNRTAMDDTYQPKSGSWGAFPRPRDISKAYGGGRRVGPGYSNEQANLDAAQATANRLRRYREKVGIEVESEKIHAAEIEEALGIGNLAMQRGVYATAVSALEKVTKYCSSNSPVGGKVFLELAMAYEAMGKANEAITIYKTLTKCRIEEIKINAKKLLYGIEAIEFMKNDVGSPEFSRKRAKNTFIDTTGMDNFASNFDDRYETAFIDMSSNYYKKLTESVVRSTREARQILLRAVGPSEIGRLRIVQALRTYSRNFEEELEKEARRNAPASEPVAVIDGVPIISKSGEQPSYNAGLNLDGEFVLADADIMVENLDGEWRLQLLADKQGDGVKYFNNSNSQSWQVFDVTDKTFVASASAAFSSVAQSGEFSFDAGQRVIERTNREGDGGSGGPGNLLSSLFSGMGGVKFGAVGAISEPQQVLSVDSVLLITRRATLADNSSDRRNKEEGKDYFAVWRSVEPGTFSSKKGKKP